jgi:hypothetical protein
VSRRRRAIARREREWAKGRVVKLTADENKPDQISQVVRLEEINQPDQPRPK